MSRQQHNAVLLPAAGVALKVGQRATPTPGPGQVLVRNQSVGFNPVDVFMTKTGFQVGSYGYPAVIGADGAGTIAELGEGVTGWKIGDRVLYQSAFDPDRGTFQELTIADAERVAGIPKNLSYEEAATVPLTLATAAIGAYQAKSDVLRPDGQDVGGAGLTPPWEEGGRGKYEGKVALVIGGSSSVGQYAIQLAKLSGFSTIITTASKHNEAYCKSAGATHVIDYHIVPYAELSAEVKAIVGDKPLTYIYDAISSAESQKASWEALSPGGALVVVLPASTDIGKPGKDDENGRRVVAVFGTVNDPENWAFGKKLYGALPGLLEKGELRPHKIENVGKGLEAVLKGVERLEKGISGVKLVASL
ncbi:unnamed protein product [Peniophora sp. CBMAI 1063]|nr:unnamed protein product [Peniophora sp. CBMAI 1063]